MSSSEIGSSLDTSVIMRLLTGLQRLLSMPSFVLHPRLLTPLATEGLATAKPGFLDRLIHAEATTARLPLVNFEKTAARLPHTQLLKATDCSTTARQSPHSRALTLYQLAGGLAMVKIRTVSLEALQRDKRRTRERDELRLARGEVTQEQMEAVTSRIPSDAKITILNLRETLERYYGK